MFRPSALFCSLCILYLINKFAHVRAHESNDKVTDLWNTEI
jgi:hypothetical protein